MTTRSAGTLETLTRALSGDFLIAPSLLSADPLNFGSEMAVVEAAGADLHHVDVMDGHFVPNLTFGLPVIAALKKKSSLPLDVHIMISNPDQMAMEYVKAGADILTFHLEAATHPVRIAQSVRQAGALVGVSLNPGTMVEAIGPLLPFIDLVLVMTVNPGFGGQSFIEPAVHKIEQLTTLIRGRGFSDRVAIEVDGGIDRATAPRVARAGAHIFVAGNAIYGQKDRPEALRNLRAACQSA